MQYLLSEEEYKKTEQGKEAFDLKVKEAVTAEVDRRFKEFKIAFAQYVKTFLPHYGTLTSMHNSGIEGFIHGLQPFITKLHGE